MTPHYPLSLGPLTIFLFILSALFVLGRRLKTTRRPPGPRGWPIIGNILKLPTGGSEWVNYYKMGKDYKSDLLYFNGLGNSVLVVNSYEAIADLLEKRSAIYSSRPRNPMLCEVVEWGDANFSILPYGASWRSHRRLFHNEFTTRGFSWHHPQQTRGVHDILKRLLESPDEWHGHLRHQAGATILDVAYGIQAMPKDDPYITLADEAVRLLSPAAIPGRFLVNTIPLLKHLPTWILGASYREFVQEGNRYINTIVGMPFDKTKEAIADGTARPCFAVDCLQGVDIEGDVAKQEDLIKDCASVMFVAGADTTVSAFATFFLAMVKYPDVQAKAQAELDTVLGREQLPTFGDEDSLPYLTAVVRECLRWEIVAPIAIPHQSIQDDEYRGYHIPAGTIVIPNSWAVLNDEDMYPNPRTFNPDRFMKDGKLNPDVRDPGAAFGYGRRICPGRHMALGTVWLTAGSILACFSIEKAIDANGDPIEPLGEYISSSIRHPVDFPCSIKPRSSKVAHAIQNLSSTVS